jgi:hypothetical protein
MRLAPQGDELSSLRATGKQSRAACAKRWIASSLTLLAMTAWRREKASPRLARKNRAGIRKRDMNPAKNKLWDS